MNAIGLFFAVSLCFAPGDAAQQIAGDLEASSLAESNQNRSEKWSDLTRRVDHALRLEADAKTSLARAHAVLELCDLHLEIACDPQLASRVSFQTQQNRVAAQLRRIERDMQTQVAARRQENPSQSSDILLHVDSSLGPLSKAAQGVLSPRGGGPGAFDYGPELVELIQRVISPDIWEGNGGRSTIVYFAPLRVLVVAAPDEVHSQVGGLMEGLRAAAR